MIWISQDKFRFSGSVPGSLVFRHVGSVRSFKGYQGFYRIGSVVVGFSLDDWIRALTFGFFHRIIEK
jgi:hypothetical protein